MSTETVQTTKPIYDRHRAAHYQFLKVNGWKSEYNSVDNLLRYLARKSGSESSKRIYCWQLYHFCLFTGMGPDELATLKRDRAENLAQKFADRIGEGSPRYANMSVASLRAFYLSNGYKHGKTVELESFHVRRRFRVVPEYIPTKGEVYRMADSASSLRDRAIILTMFSSGLRNSTLRALLYQDVSTELVKGIANVRLPVYLEMKKNFPDACKGGIEYDSFACDEATQAIKLYLKERERKYGKTQPNDPLFASDYNQTPKGERNSRFLSDRELQIVIKAAAKKADLAEWGAVHPHCLRKSFETVLHTQLIDGTNMDVKVQEVLMGHILPGSQDNYFDRSKIEWLRIQYSKLKFGRAAIENKFRVIQSAIVRAFEGTDVDPEKALEEYMEQKKASGMSGNAPSNPSPKPQNQESRLGEAGPVPGDGDPPPEEPVC